MLFLWSPRPRQLGGGESSADRPAAAKEPDKVLGLAAAPAQNAEKMNSMENQFSASARSVKKQIYQ
jgi:hypothetical protein